MGTTRISWLKKVSDGFIFREGFENRYFVDNDQWQTIQGIPEITDVRAVADTFSLDMGPASNDDNGRPVLIRKPISTSPALVSDWLVTVWYYDTMDVSLEGPFLKVKTADNKYYQIGVRNAVSTTKYAVNQDATTTEDTFKASSVSRSAAWKKLQIHKNITGNTVDLLIDNTIVQSIAYVSLGDLNTVYIQGAILGNVTNSFGYFDELRVQNSKSITFYGLSGRSIAFAGNAAIPVSTEPYTLASTELPGPSLYDFQVSKIENAASLDLYWLSQEFNGGDVFYFNSIDFGRKALPVDYSPGSIGSRNTSLTGRTESKTSGFVNRLNFTVQILEGETWKQYETLLFDWLRQGNPVSVSLDSDDSAMTKILVTYPKAGISSLTLQASLGVNTAGFSNGNYILESADRINRQILTVTGNTAGVIAFTPPLNTNFSGYDVIRSVSFFPMMIIDPNTSQMKYQDARYRRYNWPFQMVEYVP